MSRDEALSDQSSDVDAICSVVLLRPPLGKAQLPDWVHEPAAQVDRPKSALLSVDTLLTVDEVAAYLRVSTKTVRRQIIAGHIPAIRIGRSVRVSPEALEYLINYNHKFIDTSNEYRRE
jgi:excisionase family DNA binding protein